MTTARMTTARMTENDGRQWFAVTFDDDSVEITVTIGLTDDGTYLDADGCPLGDSSRDDAARRAIGKLVVETLGAVAELQKAVKRPPVSSPVLVTIETDEAGRESLFNLLKRIGAEV